MGGKLARLGFVLACVAVVLAVGAGLGNRFGFWGFRAGFEALGWIVYVGAAAAVMSLVGAALVWKESRGAASLALIGLILGAAVAWIPYQGQKALRAGPRLSDYTTDTVNPPAYVAALAARKAAKARNTTDYSPKKAEIQAKTFPDLKPILLAIPPDAAFDKALATIKAAGLEILAADKAAGRIEAVATTFWFGFKDDVVVRVMAAPGGSRVDIRSSSRIGGREAGTNPARIRRLTTALTAK